MDDVMIPTYLPTPAYQLYYLRDTGEIESINHKSDPSMYLSPWVHIFVSTYIPTLRKHVISPLYTLQYFT